MPLINTIQQLQKYVRVAYTSQQTVTMPNMEIADEDYLWPVLGEDLYRSLLDINDTAADDLKRLKELCCRVVAPLAVSDFLPRKQVSISDIGIHSKTTESDTPVTRWAYFELRNSLLDDGCKAFERLYLFLLQKAASFNWQPTGSFPESLFDSGTQFSSFYNLQFPYRIFAALLPEIALVQDHYLYPAVGRSFCVELKSVVAPSDKQTEALRLMRSAVANLTIAKYCQKRSVKIIPDGITVQIGSNTDKPNQGEGNAPWSDRLATQQNCERDGKQYLAQLKEFLNDNADDFPTFKASTFCKLPQSAKLRIERNGRRRGIVPL